MDCPLCGARFDPDALTCAGRCPLAAVQGCALLCCPNCGYQMVDERKSGLARLLRRTWRVLGGPEPAPNGKETHA